MIQLDICIVVHEMVPDVFYRCLSALSNSIDHAVEAGVIHRTKLWIGYNGHARLDPSVEVNLTAYFDHPFTLFSCEENLGYGGSNNRLLDRIYESKGSGRSIENAVLVMNPDVAPEKTALTNALRELYGDKSIGFVCPRIKDWNGLADHVGHKRFPSLAVLAARYANSLLGIPWFRDLNSRYQYQDRLISEAYTNVTLCSGCFMLARKKLWQDVAGFDSNYFMYFEDFDISLRASSLGWCHIYAPNVVIKHAGGDAGTKSWLHRRMFVQSAFRFFNTYGWRLCQVGP